MAAQGDWFPALATYHLCEYCVEERDGKIPFHNRICNHGKGSELYFNQLELIKYLPPDSIKHCKDGKDTDGAYIEDGISME